MLTKEELKMRKFTEEIKSYVLENVNSEGMFTKRYTDISKDLSIPMNSVRLAILDITKTGFIEVLSAPTRGVNSHPVYRLKTGKVIALDNHTIHDEMEVEFYGVKLHMFETEIGLVLPIEELAIATLSDTSIIYKIISANAIQFEGNTIEIDGVSFINKIGALLYLTKLNLSNSLPLKMEVLNRFQTDIILHMNEVILKGKLVFSFFFMVN